MSVYSKDANRRFTTKDEAQNAGFWYCVYCNDWLQNHDVRVWHRGNNSYYHCHPVTGVNHLDFRPEDLFIDKRGRDKSF